MEEKICTLCGKAFSGEGDVCEECLAQQAEAAVEEVAEEAIAEELVAEIEEEIADEDFFSLDEPEFYPDYEEEDAPKKNGRGAKVAGMILGLVGSVFGIYYVIRMLISLFDQQAMMVQYGMASPLGFVDFLPYGVLFLYYICGIVGSSLPRKAAKASVVLLLVPFSWTLFQGIQAVVSVVSILVMGQQVQTELLITYPALFLSGVLLLVAALLHNKYLKNKA